MSNELTMLAKGIAGWPRHLGPYQPGRRQPKTVGGVWFVPHDHTRSRVKSYVALDTNRGYLGVVSVDQSRAMQAIRAADGKSAFPATLEDAAHFLASAPSAPSAPSAARRSRT